MSVNQNGITGYRITETNSVWGGGSKNISNTMGSSLWALDYMYSLVKMKCAGVNFHGGWFEYNPSNYSAIDLDTLTNKYIAKPLYYSMMLFNQAGNGKLISVTSTSSTSINLKSYSVIGNDSSVKLILINKDFTKNAFVTVNGVPGYTHNLITRLKGPAMDAISGISLGESMVQADGTWANKSTEKPGYYQNKNNVYQVRVPAGSAVLLALQK
jgi:hypothetical protein